MPDRPAPAPPETLREALEQGVFLRGRSESSACRYQVSKLVPYVAFAPHSGHRVRRELARLLRPRERARRREESPGTDRLVSAAPLYVAGLDSRLDYDVELPEDAPPPDLGFYRGRPSPETLADSRKRQHEVFAVLEAIVQAVLARFGACLVFEITASSRKGAATFDVATAHLGDDRARFSTEIDAWRAVLSGMRVLRKRATVTTDAGDAHAGEVARRLRALSPHVIVLPTAVKRVYMDERSGSLYPVVVRSLRRDLARAMARVATTFARARTSWRPPSSAALRTGHIPEAARRVDRALTSVSRQIRLIRSTNPVNAEQERQRFLAANGDYSPRFRYRPLEFDPADLKRRLYSVSIEAIEDPELERLYAAKRRELDLKVDLLSERGTADFLLTSLKLWGKPDEKTLADARALMALEATPEPAEIDAWAVKERLDAEVRAYQERDPGFRCPVVVKSGLASRAMTLEGRVELRAESGYSVRLAEGLAAHEVGVHALTTHNGERQPLEVLRYGLPGSRRTQEGLAVFAEYRAGALTSGRLKTLGIRTTAVGLLTQGASFVEAIRFVRETHGLELDDAYELVFRLYRGGGLTKDCVYLPGFLEVVRYWLEGRDLSMLCAGKIAVEHASVVRDLVLRGVLNPPRLLPRFLEDEPALQATRALLGLLRPGTAQFSVADLLAPPKKNGDSG